MQNTLAGSEINLATFAVGQAVFLGNEAKVTTSGMVFIIKEILIEWLSLYAMGVTDLLMIRPPITYHN